MPYYKNFTMSTIVLTDGTAVTPLTHTLDTESGTLEIGGVIPGLREVEVYERKGKFVSAAYGARKYPTFSLEANLAQWKDTGSGTVSDMILGTTGTPYATRKSTIAPTGAGTNKVPLALDVTITIEGTDFGDSADASGGLTDLLIQDFKILQEGSPNKIVISGIVLGALTGDFAQTVS